MEQNRHTECKILAIGCLLLGVASGGLATAKDDLNCSDGKGRISSNNMIVKFGGSCGFLTINGDNNKAKVVGSSGKVSVGGENNLIGISGSSKDLKIGGDNNTIIVGHLANLWIGGDGNTVQFQWGDPSSWFVAGDRNKVIRLTGATTRPKPSKPNKTRPRKPASTTHSTASRGILPPKFKNMWFIYNKRTGRKWSAMLFSDGTVTSDVTGVLKNGVAASKRSRPNKWARARVSSNRKSLIVKFPKWKREAKYYTSDPSIKMNSNFKLTGCWRARSTSTLGITGLAGSSASISSRELCFNRNGRFSHDSSFAIGTTGARSLGTNTSGKHGTYRINGNTIVLKYANGKVLRTVFGAYRFGRTDRKIEVITVGSGAYH